MGPPRALARAPATHLSHLRHLEGQLTEVRCFNLHHLIDALSHFKTITQSALLEFVHQSFTMCSISRAYNPFLDDDKDIYFIRGY